MRPGLRACLLIRMRKQRCVGVPDVLDWPPSERSLGPSQSRFSRLKHHGSSTTSFDSVRLFEQIRWNEQGAAWQQETPGTVKDMAGHRSLQASSADCMNAG